MEDMEGGEEEMERALFVNSKGHCLLCLVKLEPEEWEKEGSSSFSVSSLKCLSRYLKMDMTSVFNEKGMTRDDSQSHHQFKGSSSSVELKVSLCEGCASINQNFWGLYKQLEEIEMKVASCLKLIRNKVSSAEETGLADQFRKRDVEIIVPEHGEPLFGKDELEIVESVRKEVLEKCSRKLTSFTFNYGLSWPTPNQIVEEHESDWNISARSGSEATLPSEDSEDGLSSHGSEKSWIRSEEGSEDRFNFTDSKVDDDFKHEIQDNNFENEDDNDGAESGGPRDLSNLEEMSSEEDESGEIEKESRKKNKNTSEETLPLLVIAPPQNPNADIRLHYTFDPKTGRHQCKLCPKQFKNANSFSSHYKSAHLKVRYMCTICNKEFPRRDNYLIHHRNFHDKTRFKCDICSETFPRPGQLKSHKLKEHNKRITAAASMPETRTRSSKKPVKRIRIESTSEDSGSGDGQSESQKEEDSNLEESSVESDIESSKSKKDKKKRLPLQIIAPSINPQDIQSRSTVDPETGSHRCNSCSKEFKTSSTFRSHYKSAHLQVRYKCTLCSKQFRRRDNFLHHYTNFHTLNRFQCDLCNKNFTRKCLLRSHQLTEHKKVTAAAMPEKRPKPSNPVHSADMKMEQSNDSDLETNHPFKARRSFRKGALPLQVIIPSGNNDTMEQFTIDHSTGTHKCKQCQKEFKNLSIFRYHYESIHLKIRYKCTLCGKELCRKESFLFHYRSSHEGIRFKCDICLRSFGRKDQLASHHLKEHNEINASAADMDVDPISSLKKRPLPLLVINPSANTSDIDVMEHASIHPETGSHRCTTCQKEYTSGLSFRTHYESAHLKIRYKCTLCDKILFRKEGFLDHYRSSHNPIKFKCDICLKTFTRKTLLISHKLTEHHQINVVAVPDNVIGPSHRRRKRSSTGRPTSTSAASSNDHHPETSLNPETGKFKCSKCPTEFKTKRNFQEHYKERHMDSPPRYKCPVCGKTFPRRHGANRHHRTAHMGFRFPCKVCGKTFSMEYTLKMHLLATSCGEGSGVGPAPKRVCHICGKSFVRGRGLNNHMKAVHLQLRKYLCELCGKRFKTREHLNTHRKGVHLGTLKKKE